MPGLSSRGGCTPGNSRLGQLAAARAHREDSARARRGQVTLSVTAAAVPASRLPPRVMQPSGLRPSPTDAAAETGRWATSHRDVAAPEGEPSRCAAESLQKAKSRLPPWGRWTRVSEDGEGKLPAAPSHGLCGSAGGLPSQSPNGDSSPEGGAKSRLPLWGRCPRRGRRGRGTPPSGKGASLFP